MHMYVYIYAYLCIHNYRGREIWVHLCLPEFVKTYSGTLTVSDRCTVPSKYFLGFMESVRSVESLMTWRLAASFLLISYECLEKPRHLPRPRSLSQTRKKLDLTRSGFSGHPALCLWKQKPTLLPNSLQTLQNPEQLLLACRVVVFRSGPNVSTV